MRLVSTSVDVNNEINDIHQSSPQQHDDIGQTYDVDVSSNGNISSSSWRTYSSRGNKVLNAFDLVNISGGFALDRLFIPGDEINSGARTGRRHAGLQFTSNEDPSSLTNAVKDALVEMGFELEVEEVPESLSEGPAD